jgi:ribosome biogenesis GTPase
MEALIRLYTQIGYPCLKMCAATGEGLSDLKQALLGKISLFSGHSGVGKSTIINLLSPDINLRTNEISEYHKKGMHTTTFSEMIPLPIAESESHTLIGGEYVSETPEKSGSDNAVPEYGNVSGQPEKAGTSLPLAGGGYVIDTPGIKGFGTIEMEGAEISHYFKEIFQYAASCRFNNCTHRNEPGCAVVKAVKDQYISESRYKSYLNILEDKDDSKYREAY